jgi:hypothetical protein
MNKLETLGIAPCRREKLLDARKLLRSYRPQWVATAGPGRYAASVAAAYCNKRSYILGLTVQFEVNSWQCFALAKADHPIFVITNTKLNPVQGNYSYTVSSSRQYVRDDRILLVRSLVGLCCFAHTFHLSCY